MSSRTYVETFDEGPGGWYGYFDNARGPRPLERRPGRVIARSPWWVDYNHAPPGAGYLHMLFCLATLGPIPEHYAEVGGPNRLVAEGFPTDFRNARMTLRLKGELEARGAEIVLLVQATADRLTSGWALTGQPFRVTEDWSEQTATAALDPGRWTCLGGRHGRQDYYGRLDLEQVLGNVNLNLMLILFPLTIEPMGPIDGDPHHLRAGKDYPVWRSRLPEGYVMLDTIRIEFA